MKNYILFFTIIFLTVKCFSQAPKWAWAKSTGHCNPNSLVSDTSGNVFFIGDVGNGAIFGNDTIHTRGMIIIKYLPNGNILWSKVDSGWLGASMTTLDISNNLYIAGYFVGDSATGILIIGSDTLFNSGSASHRWNMLILKCDSNGNPIWARSAGQNAYAWSSSVTTDNHRNVYVTGGFTGDSLTFGNQTIVNSGYYDFFIVKYDSSGNVMWAKDGGGISYEISTSIFSDINGNTYLSGFFESPSITFDSITLNNAGDLDMFLVKYDSSGNVIWARSAGGTNAERANSISMDDSGNVYVGGFFHSTQIIFESIVLTNSYSCNDLFLVKYDLAGHVIWATSAGGDGCDEINSISTDRNGNTYITGFFTSSQIIFGYDTLSTNGNEDIFVVKYDLNGMVIWAKSFGNYSLESISSIIEDGFGNVYLTGYFQSSSITLDSITLINSGQSTNDSYFGKINSFPVGIVECPRPPNFIVSPNPITNRANITFNSIQENTTIIISDILGHRLKKINFNGQKYLIENSDFKPGIYFIEIQDKNKNVWIYKIIVE